MISCTTIGTNGRLGNQMFQAAATIGIANTLGQKYYFSHGRLNEVFTLEGLENREQEFPIHFYNEKSFSYNKDVENLAPNTEIFGFFQTEKYWIDSREKIIKAFTVKKEIQDSVPDEIKSFCKNATSLHVRRTDYLTKLDFHPIINPSEHLSLVKRDEIIAVFTDDISYGESLLEMLIANGCSNKSRVISSFGLGDSREFYLMTLCSRAILANSSFSWWAAYLGPHQRGQEIYVPSKWFGPSGPRDVDDIFLENWRKF